jgi:predicted transcriptional regulator
MAAKATVGAVALLAIKPRFAQAIIAGHKTVEFRRIRFRKPPTHIILYASSPVRKIVAYFEVTAVKELSPVGLWRQFRTHGAIGYDEFSQYYRGRTTGIAIQVGTVQVLSDPTPLGKLLPRGKPPQSFQYLCPGSLNRLANCGRKNVLAA